MGIAVVVFTRDLRVRDHPALVAACASDHVVPLFVLDDTQLRGPHACANRIQFLLDSLADLDGSLRGLGGALIVRRGDWVDEVARVADTCGAAAVHLSDDVSGFARARLDALTRAAPRGCAVITHPGVTVVAPGTLRTGAGTAYQVFSPYHRRWISAPWRDPVGVPPRVSLPDGLDPGARPKLGALTDNVPSTAVARGGERAALARLRTWRTSLLAAYAEHRDAIAADATSHCSPYLHFGCLSSLEVATRLRDRNRGEAFVRQLCWRDFFHQLLAARPQLATHDLSARGTSSGTADEAFAA